MSTSAYGSSSSSQSSPVLLSGMLDAYNGQLALATQQYNDLQAAYTGAMNQASAAGNQAAAGYQGVLSGVRDTLGLSGAQGPTRGQFSLTTDQKSAVDAQTPRQRGETSAQYSDRLSQAYAAATATGQAGLDTQYQAALKDYNANGGASSPSNWGIAAPAARDIQAGTTKNLGTIQQQMIGSGLGGTSVLGNLANQAQYLGNQALAGLGSNLAGMYAGAQERLGGAGQQALLQGGLAAAQLGGQEGSTLAGFRWPTIPNLYGTDSSSTSTSYGTSSAPVPAGPGSGLDTGGAGTPLHGGGFLPASGGAFPGDNPYMPLGLASSYPSHGNQYVGAPGGGSTDRGYSEDEFLGDLQQDLVGYGAPPSNENFYNYG